VFFWLKISGGILTIMFPSLFCQNLVSSRLELQKISNFLQVLKIWKVRSGFVVLGDIMSKKECYYNTDIQLDKNIFKKQS